jgi:hypothetical protein
MSRLFFIRFEAASVAAAFVLAAPIVGFAWEKTRDWSPDGRFAMSLEDGKNGEVRITLAETKTHKFVRKLADSSHPYSDASRIFPRNRGLSSRPIAQTFSMTQIASEDERHQPIPPKPRRVVW